MNSLSVGQEDNAKVAICHLGNSNPATHAAVPLNHFMKRRSNSTFYPGVENCGTIWASSNLIEIAGRLHCKNVPKCEEVAIRHASRD
jgi:hypothetical protein